MTRKKISRKGFLKTTKVGRRDKLFRRSKQSMSISIHTERHVHTMSNIVTSDR